jgi:periplasmic mercuric ion binding protein
MAISWLRRLVAVSLLAAATALAADPKTVTLDVPSMFCSLCQISVCKALERLPGVVEARADNNSKRAEVKYDPDKVSAEGLAEALTKAGFPAKVRTQ